MLSRQCILVSQVQMQNRQCDWRWDLIFCKAVLITTRANQKLCIFTNWSIQSFSSEEYLEVGVRNEENGIPRHSGSSLCASSTVTLAPPYCENSCLCCYVHVAKGSAAARSCV